MSDEMWAYVDESGCMGMKVGSGSSPFFTVSTVIFSNKSEVTRSYNRIEELKNELKIGKEFKFSGSNHDQRVGFFREMCAFDFSYFAIVFDKAQIGSFNRPFLHLAVLTAFAQHSDKIARAKVVIDRTGSSEFRKMMARRLKEDLNRQCEKEVVNQVKSVASHSNNLLQLADMVCGAVARSHHPDKVGRHNYRQIICRKEWSVTVLP